MGFLSNRIKSNFLDLLKCLNSLNWFIVFLSLINLSVCIYEDQVGKFDWRQTYVGRIKFAQFDTVSTARKIIVGTEENVLAALHLKTGQVVWRHVFENSASGDIQLLHVSEKVLTVSGSNPYLVRGWDSATGVLLWEWSLSINGDHETSDWFVQNGLLVHMLPVFGSHIEVTTYNMMTGQNRGATSRLPAVWTNKGCVLAAPYYACVSGGPGTHILLSLDVTSNAIQILSKPLVDLLGVETAGDIRPLDGDSVVPGFIVDGRVVLIKNGYEVVKEVKDASVAVVDSVSGPLLLQLQNVDGAIALSSYSMTSSKEIHEVKSSDRNVKIPSAKIVASMCTKSPREQYVCRLLVNGDGDSATMLQQAGRVVWTREEALANVEAAEFVDLPVSDLEAAIELEFDLKEASVWTALQRRLSTQWQQLRALSSATAAAEQTLVRDYFNLHKILVLVTRAGKIFGMDNLSGELLWQVHVPDLDTKASVVFSRRSARHPPLSACVTIVGKDKNTGYGLVVSLDPITGSLTEERVLRLSAPLKQAARLQAPDGDKLRALVLLYADDDVQVLPESASRLVTDLYMFVAEVKPAAAKGYALKYDGTKVVALPTWTFSLGPEHSLSSLAVAPAGPQRRGRALADRSVLYHHAGPGQMLVVAEGPREAGKDTVVATCLDAISGVVLTSQVHRRARATNMAFLSENFMAYIYINEKTRRTEIASIELYEGAPGAPVSARAAFVAPSAAAAHFTRTQQALAHTHALLALTTGAIVEVPWAFLDPRRPLAPTQEQREEGLVPYAPELPLPPEATINYNRTVERPKRIYTAPSGLESTCLVLVTGLDLFYTRMAPSKTFDLLKDDFDYYLITIVLAGLIAATYSSKYFASRKMLRMAWK